MEKHLEMKQKMGAKLCEARVAMGKRLIDVEVELGINVSNSSKIENGKGNPCIDTYFRYAAYVGKRLVIDLVDEEDDVSEAK